MARAWQAAAARVCLPARPARSLASSTCAARDARAGGKAPGGACCAAGGKGGTHLAGGWCPCRVTRGWEESGERGCSGGVWMASEGPGSGGLAVPFPGLLPPPRAFSSSSPPAIPAATAPVPPRPPTPRVVLARIPAFLFRLTSPPRRREAGPRVDPGLFGGGRAVPCPPNPRASLSPVARPWLPRGVFGASRDGLCPPAAGSGPGFLPAVGPPCLRSTAPILPPLGPGPLSLSSAAAAAAALLAVGAVVGRRPSGSRVTGRQCHVRPAFRGRAARRTEFVTRRQGRRSLGAPGCGAFPPSLPRLARLPLSRYLARPGAEV